MGFSEALAKLCFFFCQNDEHESLWKGAELDVIPDMIMAGSFKHVGENRQTFH